MQRPNILVLQVDQQAASALAAYGNRVAKTPNIDRLARRSVIFDNAYTNFPVCAPSRFSMMSGRLASAIGCYDNASEFTASTPTMAHYLRTLDYQTCLSGKMHFIGPDQLHGFEDRLTAEIYPADFMTLPRWEETLEDDFATDAAQALAMAGPAPRTVQMDYDEEVAFQAERKLHDLARGDDPRSFFLVVSFTHPHEPYVCQQRYWDLYRDSEIESPLVGRLGMADLDDHSRRLYRHYNFDSGRISDQDVRNCRRAYYGSMTYVDEMIGRLLDTLEILKLDRNTVIVFTSDHGDMLGERGMWFKKTMFENAVRIPLLLHASGLEPRRVARNVSLIDLLPTFLEIADPQGTLVPAGPLDGRSLMDLARGDDDAWPDTIYSEINCEGVIEPVVMVKQGARKYIHASSADPILFDLARDPRERENLAGAPAVRELEDGFKALIAEQWGDLDRLRERIVESQTARALVRDALARGRYESWDYRSSGCEGDRYLRAGKSYNDWNYSGVAQARLR